MIIFEIPIIFIVIVVLGLLGMNIAKIVQWVTIIAGIINALYGIIIGIDPWDGKERIKSILFFLSGVILFIISFRLETASFSLYDIIDKIFKLAFK